jgi:hypothetical protein
MSNLYDILPSLTPTQAEIIEAELLAKQILEAEFPNLDLREGTGMRDLLLRPMGYAFSLLKKANDTYFSANTLKGVNDTTSTEIVDDILSNWFMTRHTGTNAVISARMFFARQKTVTIPSSVYFSTDNSLKFYPSSTQTFQSSAMAYDSYQNEWYVDVFLTAESPGTSYNIGSGSLLYFTNFDPYFLHGEINYLSQSSTDAETNSQFIARSGSAISTRNLINNPSVISNLQATFNQLNRVTPVGMGDPDMIRDQVKVLFDPESPRLATSLVRSGSTATLTLNEHGFEVGQIVNIYGATPSDWNGQFTITAKDINTFSFTLATTPSAATSMPYVQSVTLPCLVHIGGKVDVYCGDDVSSDIIQLTTDSDGRATLSGPIFDYQRSQISGGAQDDTIPYSVPVTIASTSLDTTLKTLHVTTSAAHGLSNSDLVQVSGFSQKKAITTITCTNLVVTVTIPGHGLTSGNYVTVSGVTPVTYNGTFQVTVLDANTFTYVLSANVLVAGTGTSMAISNPAVIGEFPIAYTGTTTFDIVFTEMWSGAVNDATNSSITHNIKYTVSNPNLQVATLTSLNGTGTTVTATLANHGFAAGRYVTIAGATPSYYNGTWKITEVLSADQFTFSITSAILAPATGTITAQYCKQWQDFGFSTQQDLYIDFGAGYANSTASFQIQYFTNVAAVQDYLNSTDVHILCGDYIARGYNLHVLDLNVVVYNGVAPTTGMVQAAAQAYLNTLGAGGTFILNDLGAYLKNAGISSLQTPIGVNYTFYHRDLITPIKGTVVDYLDPVDKTNVFVLGNITTDSLNV